MCEMTLGIMWEAYFLFASGSFIRPSIVMSYNFSLVCYRVYLVAFNTNNIVFQVGRIF